MKTEQEVDQAIEEASDELDKIAEVDDLEQQGYLAAPVICRIMEITPMELTLTFITMPSDSIVDRRRDAGAMRWCREQQETKQ